MAWTQEKIDKFLVWSIIVIIAAIVILLCASVPVIALRYSGKISYVDGTNKWFEAMPWIIALGGILLGGISIFMISKYYKYKSEKLKDPGSVIYIDIDRDANASKIEQFPVPRNPEHSGSDIYSAPGSSESSRPKILQSSNPSKRHMPIDMDIESSGSESGVSSLVSSRDVAQYGKSPSRPIPIPGKRRA